MTTLITAPLAPLLDRLFAEAADWPTHSPALDAVLDQARERRMRSKAGYLGFYRSLKDLPLAVTRETGLLLYMLARSRKARTVVEFGTSLGVSALHLAAALRDNGGGRLIATEFEPSKVAGARQNLRAAGLLDLVEIREGDAVLTLATDLPDTIDLVWLDGAKALYREVLNVVEGRLAPDALVIADDSARSPDYLAYVRNPANGYLSLPFGDDLELSLRLG